MCRRPCHCARTIWLLFSYSNLSTEATISAAALVLTGLPPGPPRTASLLSTADPTVAWQALTGEGGGAGPVFAVHTLRDTLLTIFPSLSVPLATGLHWGVFRAEYSIFRVFYLYLWFMIVNTKTLLKLSWTFAVQLSQALIADSEQFAGKDFLRRNTTSKSQFWPRKPFDSLWCSLV